MEFELKFAFGILLVFILTIALESHARDLSFKEKTVILNLEKTKNVFTFSLQSIDVSRLSLTQFLSYKVLKNSCRPLESLLGKISNENEDYKDQSNLLDTYMNACSQGTISLVDMYLENHQ